MIHATTQINLKNIMLSERSQTQKTTYCMSLLIYNVQRGKFIEAESRLVVVLD